MTDSPTPSDPAQPMEFTMSATVDAPYAATVEDVRALLGDAGFGVMTEIDIRATLKAKLDVNVAPQLILGACRPELAHRALQADPRIATLLPCNVVVTAVDAQHSRVEVLDPAFMTTVSPDPELGAVAADARSRLATMIETLTSDAGRSATTGERHATSAR